MHTDCVLYEVIGRSAVITLDRPDKLNAISADMVSALHLAMDRAEADEKVHVIVLKGAGRHFSAGFDLGEVALEPSRETMEATLKADFDVIMRFWHSPKPTLSVVRGYALGGGFELAMACDMTIATEDAVFGEPEPKFGSGIVALLLPWVTGPKQAKEMLLFGADRIDARRASEMGLVNRVVADDDLDAEAERLARASALLDQTAARLTKRAVNQSYRIMGMDRALYQALAIDVDIEVSHSEESRAFKTILNNDGVKAAIAWREARWDSVAE